VEGKDCNTNAVQIWTLRFEALNEKIHCSKLCSLTSVHNVLICNSDCF
jgi:hypothetical protein